MCQSVSIARTGLLPILLAIIITSSALAANAYYVDLTNGNDGWSGTIPSASQTDGPFASLERARDAIRALKASGQYPAGGVTVYILGGPSYRGGSFILRPEDSGAPGAPVVYQAYKHEHPRLMGAAPVANFTPVTNPGVLNRLSPAARANVVQADLHSQGINHYGQFRARGYFWARQYNISPAELFFKDRPMTLARYPNSGYTRTTGGSWSNYFFYGDPRPANWAYTTDKWVMGYWGADNSDSHERIVSINTGARQIVTETVGAYGFHGNARFYYYNVFEELDSPGEYFIDRGAGILYFWPPEPVAGAPAVVSMVEAPLIQIQGASNVVIRGLTIESTRGDGVWIEGGSYNTIGGCTIRNIGGQGVVIKGGVQNSIVSCDIYDTAENGVLIDRGRQHMVHNCEIHHWGRWSPSYHPAIQCGMYYTNFVDDDGHRITHNLIHDGANMAVQYFGNNMLIEYNEIHHACYESSDIGTIYTIDREGRYSGTVIRYNYLHHQRTNVTTTYQGWKAWTMAIYLDENASRTTVYGNILVDNREYGGNECYLLFSNGGDDVVFENNITINGEPNFGVGSWGDPKRITFVRNILNGGNWLKLLGTSPGVISFRWNLCDNDPYGILDGSNIKGQDPQFVDKANNNFQLQPTSPAFTLGFRQIPQDQIGLINDEYRSGATKVLTLAPIGGKVVNRGQQLAFQITSTGGSGDALAYSASDLPAGAAFDAATQTFSWTPAEADAGTHKITFAVTDGTETSSEAVPVVVTNLPFTLPPNYIAYWKFDKDAADVTGWHPGTLKGTTTYDAGVDNDCVLLDGATGYVDLPLGLSAKTDPTVTGATAALWWRPETTGGGSHDETLIGGFPYHWFINAPVNVPAASIYNAMGTLVNASSASPAAPGIWAHVAAVYAPDRSVKVYVNGELRNTATWQGMFFRADLRMAIGNRGNTFVAGAIDEAVLYNRALTDDEINAIYMAQNPRAGNRPPVLALIGDKRIEEGQELAFTVVATDEDNDPLTFSVEGLPLSANFDNKASMFLWTPGPGQAGTYTVTFKVSDGLATDTETITIIVVPPPTNELPVLDTIGDKTAPQEQLLQFTISATDGNGDPLTYSARDLPTGATFDPASRRFSWTPSPSQVGGYRVTFAVSDGKGSDSSVITIIVFGSASILVPSDYTAYWTFDKTMSDKTARFDGTPVGTVTYADGKRNECVRLAGSGYVDLPLNLAAAGNPAGKGVTVAAWVKPHAVESTSHDEAIVGGLPYHWFISIPGNIPTAYIYNAAATRFAVSSSEQMPLEAWTQIAAVFGADNRIKLFVNGELKGSGSWTGSFIPADQYVRIGSRGLQNINADVDEVAIYSRSFTDQDAKRLYVAQMQFANDRRLMGDVDGNCRIDLLDLITIQNRLGADPLIGDNWKADINDDGQINVLDLLTARSRLNVACP